MRHRFIASLVILTVAFSYGCTMQQTVVENHPTSDGVTAHNNDFSSRQPFKFTITTNFEHEDDTFDEDSDEYDEGDEYSDEPNIKNEGKDFRCDLSFDKDDNKVVLQSIDSWDNISWKSMFAFAADCKSLKTIPVDDPDLSHVSDMSICLSMLNR